MTVRSGDTGRIAIYGDRTLSISLSLSSSRVGYVYSYLGFNPFARKASCLIVRDMNTYRCSGDGPGTHESCDFGTDSLTKAMDHFESTGHNVDDVSPAYAVTVVDANDPESTRTLTMSENEVRDTYPHWTGQPVLTAHDGSTVHIEASL